MTRRAATLLALIFAACSRTHSKPEAADTVTNWLASCKRTSDCQGEAVCENALCTLPCSESSSSTCAAIHAEASCEFDAGACDLACASSRVCLDLGPTFACVQGHCRADGERSSDGDEPGGGGAVRLSAVPVVDEFAPPPRATSWAPDSIEDRRTATFSTAAAITLSDDRVDADGPRVDWQGDHWRVVWPTSANVGFGVARVFPAGRVNSEHHRLASASRISAVFNGLGSIVAHVARAEPGRCSLAASDLDTERSSEPWSFDCSAAPAPALAPVPGSDDWLVTWHAPDTEDPEKTDFIAARYDPTWFAWSTGPWKMNTGADATSLAGVAAQGRDLWAWGQSPSPGIHGVYRMRDLARPTAPAGTPELTRFDVASEWLQSIAPVDGGVGVFESLIAMGEPALRTTAIGGDGAVQWTHDVPTPRRQRIGGIRHVPEQEAFALCVVDEGVQLLVLDERGPVSEPFVIAADESGRHVLDCDLAYSGDRLLIVWVERENPASSEESPTGFLRAKLFGLPKRAP
jgi:hypothetical protein